MGEYTGCDTEKSYDQKEIYLRLLGDKPQPEPMAVWFTDATIQDQASLSMA